MFRERDRTLNQSVYPGLYFPEIYLLHKGYKVARLHIRPTI